MSLIKRLLIVCVVAYYGITLLIITPALNFLPAWYINKHYDRTLETGFVILNPFKLSLDISSAQLSETSGENFLSFGDTSINLSTASLWQSGWVLDELKLHDLDVRLVRLEDESFNFSNLLPPEDTAPVEEEPGEVPRVTLSVLDFQATRITVIDRTRSTPYQSEWVGLAFKVQDLSTVFEEGKPYTLDITGPQGGTLSWQGEISIPRNHSKGTLRIDGLSMVNLWHVAEPWVEFEIDSGRLDISGSYDINWGEALAYSLGDGAIDLRELSIIPGNTAELEDTRVQLKHLSISDISALSSSQHASVGLVDISGLDVSGWSEGTRASVVDMFIGLQPASSDSTSGIIDDAASAETSKPASAPQSTGTVEEQAARRPQGELQTDDDAALATDPNTPAVPAPDITDTQGPVATGDTDRAPVSDTPAANEATANATAAVSEQSSEQSDASQWSAEVAKVTLRNSALNWRSEFTEPAQLSVTPIEASLSDVSWPLKGDSPFTFSITVNDRTTLGLDGSIDPELGNGSVNYALTTLHLPMFNPNLPQALHATLTDGNFSVAGTATITEFGPGVITADGAIENFEVEVLDTENAITGWDNVAFKALSVDVPAQKVGLSELRIDGYQGRIHIFEDGSINASRVWRDELAAADTDSAQDANGAAVIENEGAEQEDAEPWDIDVRSVIMSQSKIDFMDQSLPIAFRTIIGDINGAIKNLNSDVAERADVDIKGSVDTYAPVALLGTMNPLATPMSVDLNLTFDGVDMAMLSPYSSTYAGYKIEGGLLDLDLKYALEGDALKGLNKVRLDKLKLGEKIDSDKAVDLPLELALSILTDANGVIDVQVPVAGNIDDPSFALGSVIGKAVMGLFTKIVTAPFSILASLVGSEEDLRQLTFPVGSALVDEPTAKKLNDIAEIMRQRPKIDLALTGRVNPSADRDRLQKDALDAALLESGLAAESLASRDERWEREINESFEDIGGDPNDELLSIRDKQLRVAKTLEVSDEQLMTLAQQRAAAVKTHLVNEAQIDGERIVIQQGDINDKAHRYNGVELNID